MNEFQTDLTPPLRLDTPDMPRKKRRLFSGLNELLKKLSPSERLTLYILSIVLGVSAFVLLANVNQAISTEIPTHGGSFIEGAVGTPRFVNPLLDVSETDQDLTTLIYSGLLRVGKDGTYIPDLASSYEISDDGTTYTFHLRHNLTFHDGTPLTSADVLYTVALAQNPDIKSPRRADWDSVAASAPDQYTVIFTLPHAYAPFLENTTLGIVPKHVWQGVATEEFAFSSLNTHPIGSGPYSVKSVSTDSAGAPSEYVLRSFKNFVLGEPNIASVTYRIYANDDDALAAYQSGDIDSLVVSSPKSLPQNIQKSGNVIRVPLARTFGVFLNQSHAPVLTSHAVREALNASIDRNAIITSVLGGYGVAIDGPIPPGLINATSSVARDTSDRVAAAKQILINGGWTFAAASSSERMWKNGKQTLSLTLATADTEDLVATAKAVAAAWDAIGVPTTVQIYPLSEFNSSILRPRTYDAILFGEVVGRSLDLFAFWHSSQRNDPGLNLALYASTQADKELAAARATSDAKERTAQLTAFEQTIDTDRPAVFIYAPLLAYIAPAHVQGIELGTLTTPSDRFANVYSWYRDTERVWNIFAK